ncbi:MAG TPA: type III pantothenate kinase [Steroidobacteraceae bacterium]|nr:type III pantothenate kinase [Steroidobacteraceae bacterium]
MSAPRTGAAVLLLDAGNSRIKWALLRGAYRRGDRFAASGALDLSGLAGRGAVLRRLIDSIGPLAGVAACNVAGTAVERRLRSIVRAAGLPSPRFMRSAHAAAGVRNAYAQPWRLGADRWASLVGARAEHPRRALCLVAVGTAMTIDLIDGRGRHRGGSIIPGPKLMVDSLLDRTAGIRRRAGGRSASQAMPATRTTIFARDTRGAVVAGATNAAAALVHEAMRSARLLLGRTPLLILSGGAADAVARQLRVPHRREDDLALRGLAVLHSEQAQFE